MQLEEFYTTVVELENNEGNIEENVKATVNDEIGCQLNQPSDPSLNCIHVKKKET